MLTILISAGSLIAIIILGYVLKRCGFFSMDDFSTISKLIIKITLPCAVITNFDKIQVETGLLWIAIIGIACNLIMSGFGYFLHRKHSPAEKAFAVVNFSGYNIGSFAMPYVQSFLGPLGILSVCIFDSGNSIMCTGSTYSLAVGIKGNEKPTVKAFLSRTLSSIPILTYVTMMILSICRIHLPEFVLSFADVVGKANPFLAMMTLGIAFEIHLSKDKVKQLLQMLFVRYGISVLLALSFFFLLPFPLEIRQGLVLISFAPISGLCTLFTEKIDGDVHFSGTISSISIVLSVAIMTSLMLWMQG